ncbi:hypothetical protein B0H13DRAFT_2083062 [Mycena leptocephala]|nr:hypothetical protein B0H13DRAFT_2083062 [Mycena leptocephala]
MSILILLRLWLCMYKNITRLRSESIQRSIMCGKTYLTHSTPLIQWDSLILVRASFACLAGDRRRLTFQMLQ